MSRSRRVMIVGLVAAAAFGTACTSSTTKTRESSVIPSKQARVVAFFEHEGSPLLAFERATAPLATGTRPDRATCVRLRDVVLPKVSKSPDALVSLAQRVPDKPLAAAFHTVVSLKVLVVLGCATGAAPTGAQDPKGYTSIRDHTRSLDAHLARYGIRI